MLLAAFAVGEETRAFERDLDTVLTMRKLCRILLGRDLDALTIDNDVVAVGRDRAGVFAVDAVVTEQPGIRLRVGKVVDADQLEPAIGALEDCTRNQPSDP